MGGICSSSDEKSFTSADLNLIKVPSPYIPIHMALPPFAYTRLLPSPSLYQLPLHFP